MQKVELSKWVDESVCVSRLSSQENPIPYDASDQQIEEIVARIEIPPGEEFRLCCPVCGSTELRISSVYEFKAPPTAASITFNCGCGRSSELMLTQFQDGIAISVLIDEEDFQAYLDRTSGD